MQVDSRILLYQNCFLFFLSSPKGKKMQNDSHTHSKQSTHFFSMEIPADGTIYTLAGKDGNKRATVITLNGRDLVLGENWELPDLSGDAVAAGKVELAPMTCTFLVV